MSSDQARWECGECGYGERVVGKLPDMCPKCGCEEIDVMDVGEMK
jgi:ribosomal protein S27AE